MYNKEISKAALLLSLITTFASVAGCIFSGEEDDAKDSVKEILIDPESATFRNILVSEAGVCGEVNAKNSFGGYTGYKIFFYSKSYGSIIQSDDMSAYKESPQELKDGIIKCATDLLINGIMNK